MWPVSSTAWVSAQKSAENPNKAQTAIPHAVLFFVCFRMYNFIVKAVCRELYRAIRADCWLAVEYHNRKNETTSYWIAVRDLNPRSRRLLCDGMHLGSFSIASLNLYLDQIVSAKMIRGTYAEIPETLRNDIRDNPEKYESVFAESANFAILTYLSECFRLDESPYRTDFSLVGKLDDEKVDGVSYSLSDEQFAQIVRSFVKETDDDFKGKLSIKQFGMNLLSVATAKGMYLLAYQPLRLNVGARALGAFDPPVICTENTINGKKQSVRSFLDPEFHYLLNDFKANAEKIREIITVTNPGILVDDMPYVLEVARDSLLDLPSEYEGIFEEVLDRLGEMPLPPYITHKLKDKNRYQTVYAKYEGSAAAPTAGLHFTNELLDEIRAMGVRTAFVTLHVGLGTFRPVKVDDVKNHHMHTEWYQVSEEAAELINRTHEEGRRVICVGTTSCRTVESASDENGIVHAGSDDTSIFIYPGYGFKVVDALITNFHLPESTLIMLVSAFAGREKVLNAYKEAVKEKYRFFSFGDAMFIR